MEKNEEKMLHLIENKASELNVDARLLLTSVKEVVNWKMGNVNKEAVDGEVKKDFFLWLTNEIKGAFSGYQGKSGSTFAKKVVKDFEVGEIELFHADLIDLLAMSGKENDVKHYDILSAMYVLKQFRFFKAKCGEGTIIDIVFEFCQRELRAYEIVMDINRPWM
ncbi:hypothetical protein QEG73_01750 [Chitinophagaceae bacterium 26-R-25]|nr:hypothetical protein [Chitinophagaceae bacterium 26-R-25]